MTIFRFEGAPIMNEAALFGSTFLLVFFLGLQSLNVNGGHYWAAFFTSFGIGLGNLVLFKLAPNANLTEMAAYLCGGPLGIVSAMRVHRRFKGVPAAVLAARNNNGETR